MVQERQIPELLAPAGSREALVGAVAAGADAVYLGGRQFGARGYAANFSPEEIRGAADYCHLRGVRVYVTVNTLVGDSELGAAASFLESLYEAGVDAVLIQDTGVAALARDIVPHLSRHASTQATIASREGVACAAEQGYERVVLARELPLAEVAEIVREGTSHGIGIEIFAHGALCYSFSGQCLLSSMIGGRSGNRGICAQPCRKPYDLVRGRCDEYGRLTAGEVVPLSQHYLLSTRDLSLYSRLAEVAEVGVAAIKIEGRMRSPDYVATVTSIYRHALDEIAAGRFEPSEGDIERLMLAFNRGFTEGSLFGNRGKKLIGAGRPDNRGLYIGNIISSNPATQQVSVRLSGTRIPTAGDGIAFRDASGEVRGGCILRRPPTCRDHTLLLTASVPARPGDGLWLTSDAARQAESSAFVSGRRFHERQSVILDLKAVWEDGVPVVAVDLVSPHGACFNFVVRADQAMETARTAPLDSRSIEAQLRKTGGTVFSVRNVDLRYPGGLFAPVSAINGLRRAIFEEAEKKLAAALRPRPAPVEEAKNRLAAWRNGLSAIPQVKPVPVSPVIAVYASTPEVAEGAVRAGCGMVCFEPRPALAESGRMHAGRREITELIEEVSSLCRSSGVDFVWKWPRICTRSWLDLAVPLLSSFHPRSAGVMVEDMGAAYAVHAADSDIALRGSVGLNIFNHLAIQRTCGTFTSLALSQELSSVQIANLGAWNASLPSPPEFECIVQGSAELVVSADCLFERTTGCPSCRTGDCYGLRDETGRVFPVAADGECRTHIYNAVETCLIDAVPDLLSAGVSILSIDARNRSPQYAYETCRAYLSAAATQHVPESLKNELKSIAAGGITAGHLKRGVVPE